MAMAPAFFVGGHHVRGHHGSDAEERTVRQGGDDAADHHHSVVWREGRGKVSRDKQDQQDRQHGLAVKSCHCRREHQCADDDGEGVAGDQPAGRGLADVEVAGMEALLQAARRRLWRVS
jgi:hypothetical protein